MFDTAFAFCKVIASVLAAETKHVLVQLRALGAGDDPAIAESSSDEPAYGALGVIARPRAPDTTGAAEAIAARGEDSLTPLAWRDLRLSKARGNLRDGATCLVGYGGGFVGTDDAGAGTGSIVTIYAPYQHDGQGVPAKAHSIIVDTSTGNESIVIAHADGHAILLTPQGKLVIKNKAGSVFISIEDGGVVVSGTLKATTGLVAGSPATAQEVVLKDGLFAWITEVNTAMAALQLAVGSPVPAIVAPTAIPMASTIAKASP